MRSPSRKENNWYENWSRRSRLRSGTRLLASVLCAKEEAPSNANQGSVSDTSETFSNKVAENHIREHLDDDGEDDDDDVDADYKLFLKHLRFDGKSYVTELIIDGIPTLVRYEGEDDVFSDLTESKPTRMFDVSREEKSCVGGMDTKRDGHGPNSGESFHSEHPLVGNGVVQGTLSDEEYRMFLDHVRDDDGLMVFEMDNGGIVRYEEGVVYEEERRDEKSSGDDEDMAKEGSINSSKMELQPYMGPTISLDSEDDDVSLAFEDRLKDILEVPYDQNEYEELLKVASVRMPIIRHRQLRHRSSPYPTKDLGFSYFDHYPDLAEKVQHADHPDGLKLLRGFFFWLKNVSHEGAYMPWAPPNTKEMLTDGSDSVIPLQIEMNID
ncbi:hypothetical protein DsansV1_C29g0208741 [Dioscorea sansibarensis]